MKSSITLELLLSIERLLALLFFITLLQCAIERLVYATRFVKIRLITY